MTYIPEPLDTSKITLGSELDELVEFLAKNTHENWSKERIKQGWRWGPERNDGKKEHPSLVPYEELPESEKMHDRIAATELLKTVILVGFSISKEKD